MTEEQQLMWDTLSADPAAMCHKWAQDILQSKRTMHRKADRYLGIALNLFTVEDITGIMKTWILHYNMPLDPTKLSNYDAFHRKCGHYVFKNSGFGKHIIKQFV
jgi:hypothetical protein